MLWYNEMVDDENRRSRAMSGPEVPDDCDYVYQVNLVRRVSYFDTGDRRHQWSST